MQATGTDSRLLGRLLRGGGRVVVLTGAAGCGKSTAAMEFYEHYVSDTVPGCALIAPTAGAVAAMRSRLLARAGGVLTAPRVLTFATLAERVLAAAGGKTRVISPLARQLLLQRIVEELAASRKLTALGAVADAPGLIVALDRSIAELKRAAVEPEALARAVGEAPGKARDLLEVYRRYQQELRSDGLYDLEGRMWEARDSLAKADPANPRPGLEGVRALAVDGFTDFTPTQLQILRHAAGSLERVVITLPYVEDARVRLWHWTHRTLNTIRPIFGAELEEIALPSPRPACQTDGGKVEGCRGLRRSGNHVPTTFDGPEDVVAASPQTAAPTTFMGGASLWAGLFTADAPPGPGTPGLALLAAPDIDAEVAEVARRVKALLVGGCPPGEIIVCARSIDAYRPAIERLFEAADIPVAPGAVPLTREPVVRFLLDAAGLPGEFAFRDVLRVIKNSYFLPESLGDFDATTVAAAEAIIREGNVLAGRESYALAAARLARPARRQADDDESTALGTKAFSPEALAAAGAMLKALFDLADLAVDPPGLVNLMHTLRLAGSACRHDRPDRVAGDLRALAALGEALASLGPPWPTMPRLREALASLSAPSALTSGPVQVLDVLDARALRARHVFLLGVGEGQFPPRFSDSAVLGEAQRAAWAHRGVILDSRGDLATREMLLFYLAVTRGDESLTLSYPEPEGGQLGASHFLESLLERIAVSDKPACHRVRAGWPTPTACDGRIDESRIVSVREALLAAMAGVFSRDFQGGQGALAWAARNAREPLTCAGMGLFARDRRWRRGEADAFDGRIDRDDLLADLGERFGPEHVFSSGGLSMMARCPWSFFAKYVLALEPLSQPERQLEAQSRGIFVHEVLFQALSSLAGPGGGVDLRGISDTQCADALARALAAQAQRVESRQPRFPALWRIQLSQMRQELAAFLRDQRAGAPPGECVHFELAFGPDAADEGGRDGASTDVPVAVDTPAGPVRLRGRIDRVDRVDLGADQGGLMVIDYKTGPLPSEADILAGRNLQLTLYSEAVARLLGGQSLGGVFYRVGEARPMARYFAAIKPGKGGFVPREDYQAQREHLLTLTGELVQRVRGGQFALPRQEQCSSWCPYKRICQFSPARAAVKGGADAL